jgi:hypothetical protein
LLGSLTDEELDRYSEIAGDQLQHELRHRWLQLALAGLALGSAVWVMRGLLLGHYGGMALLALGLSAVLGYWPYRKARTRRLWRAHRTAVLAEQTRRRSAAS